MERYHEEVDKSCCFEMKVFTFVLLGQTHEICVRNTDNTDNTDYADLHRFLMRRFSPHLLCRSF
jgi:hypothetical protein